MKFNGIQRMVCVSWPSVILQPHGSLFTGPLYCDVPYMATIWALYLFAQSGAFCIQSGADFEKSIMSRHFRVEFVMELFQGNLGVLNPNLPHDILYFQYFWLKMHFHGNQVKMIEILKKWWQCSKGREQVHLSWLISYIASLTLSFTYVQ